MIYHCCAVPFAGFRIDRDHVSRRGVGFARASKFISGPNGFVPVLCCVCACHAAALFTSIDRNRASLRSHTFPLIAHPFRPQYDNDFEAKPIPQKRTSSTFSITNKADAYMASLKGIKVELAENPHLAEGGDPAKQDQGRSPPRLSPRLPPPPKPPLGPTMSYAEKLKLAEEGKRPGAAATPAAAAPQAVAAPAAPAASLGSETPPPTLSYSERLKQAQEAKRSVAAAPAAPAARPPVQEMPSAPVRLLEQEVPDSELLGDAAAQAKVRTVSREVVSRSFRSSTTAASCSNTADILCEKLSVSAYL